MEGKKEEGGGVKRRGGGGGGGEEEGRDRGRDREGGGGRRQEAGGRCVCVSVGGRGRGADVKLGGGEREFRANGRDTKIRLRMTGICENARRVTSNAKNKAASFAIDTGCESRCTRGAQYRCLRQPHGARSSPRVLHLHEDELRNVP